MRVSTYPFFSESDRLLKCWWYLGYGNTGQGVPCSSISPTRPPARPYLPSAQKIPPLLLLNEQITVKRYNNGLPVDKIHSCSLECLSFRLNLLANADYTLPGFTCPPCPCLSFLLIPACAGLFSTQGFFAGRCTHCRSRRLIHALLNYFLLFLPFALHKVNRQPNTSLVSKPVNKSALNKTLGTHV
jgi:hypothetical protein